MDEIMVEVLKDRQYWMERIDDVCRGKGGEIMGLKRCPFCGGLAELKSCISQMDGNIFWVDCTVCGVSIKAFTTENAAFEKWNTRQQAGAK